MWDPLNEFLGFLLDFAYLFIPVGIMLTLLFSVCEESDKIRSQEVAKLECLVTADEYTCYVDGIEVELEAGNDMEYIWENYSYIVDDANKKLVFSAVSNRNTGGDAADPVAEDVDQKE